MCCCIDLKNAFNEISKTSILEVLDSEESLAHLTSFAASLLAPTVSLESGGSRWGVAEEGVVQGDIPSGALFSIDQQSSLLKLDKEFHAGGGLARGGFDDVYAVGRADVVLPAVMRFQQDLDDRCWMELQWGKTEWFTWDGELPHNAPQDLKVAGVQSGGNFLRGFMFYGIPLGEARYVTHQLQEKAVMLTR